MEVIQLTVKPTERHVEIEIAEIRNAVASIVIGVDGRIGRAACLLDVLPMEMVWVQQEKRDGMSKK